MCDVLHDLYTTSSLLLTVTLSYTSALLLEREVGLPHGRPGPVRQASVYSYM